MIPETKQCDYLEYVYILILLVQLLLTAHIHYCFLQIASSESTSVMEVFQLFKS